MKLILKVIYFVAPIFTFLKSSLCSNSTIYVKNCFERNLAYKEMWSRSIQLEMVAYTIDNIELDLTWEIYKIDNNNNTRKVSLKWKYSRGYNFVLEPYSLNEGFYKILVLSKDQPKYRMASYCYLRIRSESCFAFINSGQLQEYRPGETILVRGDSSKDYCYPEGKKNSLRYTWSCTQKLSTGFCPHETIGKEYIFTIPSNYVISGEEFTVTLSVVNEDRFTSIDVQKIYIKQNIMQYQIQCLQNCAPWARVKSPTVLKVKCTRYCGYPCLTSWLVNRDNELLKISDYEESCTTDLQCTFKIFKPAKIEFVYKCADDKLPYSGIAAITMDFKLNPKVTCKVDPEQGNSYSTQFSVNCQVDSNEVVRTIEVYSFKNKLRDFITTWSPPTDHKFHLPLNTENILVRVLVHPEVFSYTILKVTVKNELDSKATEETMMKIFNSYKGSGKDSITSQLERDRVGALGPINSLWNEIRNLKHRENKQFEQFLDNLKLHTIDDLLTIPVTASDNLVQLNNAVENILATHINKSDPFMEKSLSMLCKKLASDYEYIVDNGKDLFFQATVVNVGISNTLADCSVAIVNENDDLLKPLQEVGSSTDKPPFEAITEDYDYVDFGNEYYTYLEDLEEASSNILDISSTLVKAVANSEGSSGQKMYVSDNVNVSVYERPGLYYHRKLGNQGVMVFPSSDVYTSKHEFHFAILSWKKNMFWWTQTRFRPNTFVTELSFKDMNNDEQLSEFGSPNFVYLDVMNSPKDLHSEIFSVTVPAAYHRQKIDEEYMEDFINIHRISVFQHQGIFVQFHDLKGQDFLIVIKNFELPVMEDFKKESVILINENNTFSSCENNNDYDSWYYVGVLPRRSMVRSDKGNQTFQYNISFSAPGCYEFTFDQDWRRTCKGAVSTNKYIMCKCNHLSILAGKIESTASRLARLMNYHQLRLEVECNRNILWCILILFSAFWLVMLYGKHEHALYYAADNHFNDRYAYLIVVRTGRYRQITSRIVMRITGIKGHTSPRILNYPDPSNKIFQSGSEDWIVVTTNESLGDIQNIELWHDNYGIKPKWYCKDIVIHDIQTEERWVFKINETMSFCHEHRIRMAPIGTDKGRCKRFFQVLSLSAEHDVWNIFNDDNHHITPYIRRLVLLYSMLITPLPIITGWHGFPQLNSSDSIDPYDYYFDVQLFLIGFGSSFICFLFHTLVFWCKPHDITDLMVGLIVIANTVLMIFGFWIPFYSSVRIIFAWLFGIILHAGVYSTVLGFLKKIVYGVKLLDNSDGISYQAIKEEIEVQREILSRMLDSVFTFRLHQMAIPTRGKKFRHRKREDIRRTRLSQRFKDLVMFGIYILLLHAMVTIEKDHLVFRNQRVLRDLFIGKFSRTKSILDIDTNADIYNYMNTTLIEIMHGEEWYPNFRDEEPGLLLDKSNKYIGVFRFRQNRVVPRTCDVEALGIKVTCAPEFSEEEEDRRTFADSWSNPTPYIPVKKRLSQMWIYSDWDTTGSPRKQGLFSTYPGSGYLASMTRTRKHSVNDLKILRDSNWIDRFTRTIFIEFLTYNANYNVFNNVRMILERSATGLIHFRGEVFPARMIYVGSEMERKSLLIWLSFVFWLVVLFLDKSKFFLREPLTFLKDFWNLLDMVIIILSMCCVIIYLVRDKSVGELLDLIEKTQDKNFINYFDIYQKHIWLRVIGVMLVCTSTIRLWKLVRFFRMFRLFERTFRLVMATVLALFLHHVIFVMACTIIYHILLGEKSTNFVNYVESFKSLARLYLGLFDNFKFFIYEGSAMEIALIVMYVIASKMFLANYMVSCCLAYLDAKALSGLYEDETYPFIDFLKEELMFLFSWLKLRRIHHHKERPVKKQVISPKPDRYLYANCIWTTNHAMNAMTVVAAVVLYNKIHQDDIRSKRLTEKQIELMLRVCHYFFSEQVNVRDNKQFFFKVHKGKMLTIIDGRRIDKEKHLVEMILGESAKKEKRQKLNRRMVLRHAMKDLDKMQRKLQNCLRSLENIELVEESLK